MKTKNSAPTPRDSTQGLVRYCNYFMEFPDGEVWHDSTHVVGGFHAWIKNTNLYKTKPEVALKMARTGEAHWKDSNGVEHRMILSETPVERKWGLNKKVIRKSAIEI